jgi:hypothetical protein
MARSCRSTSCVRALPQADKPDVFVWAVIDWHFRIQRPQHLARAMAGRGHRVFYISNNCVDSAEAGFGLEPLDGDAQPVPGAPATCAAHRRSTSACPRRSSANDLQASLGKLLAWAGTSASMSFVQHPSGSDLARCGPTCAACTTAWTTTRASTDNCAHAARGRSAGWWPNSDLLDRDLGWLERRVRRACEQSP